MLPVYDDIDYARSRLSGTVVFHKGSPVYVYNVHSWDEVEVASCGRYSIHYYCPFNELDLNPPKLGFVNTDYQCQYLVRDPARQWKQGFRQNQISREGFRTPNINSVEMSNMYRNVYPSLDNCIELLSCGEAESQAFHKLFAISLLEKSKFRLLFKTKVVANLIPQKGNNLQVDWGPNEFLSEMFTTVMEKQNAKP